MALGEWVQTFRRKLVVPNCRVQETFENGRGSFLRNAGKHLQNYILSLPTRTYSCLVFCKPFYQSVSSYFLTYSTEPNCSSLSDAISLQKSVTGRRTNTARRPSPTCISQLCCFQHGTPLQCNNFMPTPIVTAI